MRVIATTILAIVAALAPPFATSGGTGPAELSAFSADGFGTLLLWERSSEDNAMYRIYRGADIERMTYLGATELPTFHDPDPIDPRLFYIVTIVLDDVESPLGVFDAGGGGTCVATSSSGSASVRLHNCVSF